MDELVRGLLFDGRFRFLAAVSTGTVEEARRRHDLWPTAAAALGRSLTAAGLMAFDLKAEGSITLRFQGKGPLGTVVAQGRREEEAPTIDVRGYVGQNHVDLDLREGKLDVGRAVGSQGTLYVVRREGSTTFTGTAPLLSGEIAEDLAYYFQQSEQRSTAVALGVLVEPSGQVSAAGGFIIERLPGAGEEATAALEKGLLALGSVTEKLRLGYGPVDLMREVAGGEVEIGTSRSLRFHCPCHRERAAGAVKVLGLEDAGSLLRERGDIEVTCRFCGARYTFTAEDLSWIFAEPED